MSSELLQQQLGRISAVMDGHLKRIQQKDASLSVATSSHNSLRKPKNKSKKNESYLGLSLYFFTLYFNLPNCLNVCYIYFNYLEKARKIIRSDDQRSDNAINALLTGTKNQSRSAKKKISNLKR